MKGPAMSLNTKTEFLPALKGGVNLAGLAPGSGGTFNSFLHNAKVWAEIADFLIDQELARLGLRRVSRRLAINRPSGVLV